MERLKKYGDDIEIWIVLVIGVMGVLYSRYYFIFKYLFKSGIEIGQESISVLYTHITYVFIIMCLTFIIGFLAKEHVQSTSFTTLVVVVTIFLIIPNMFLHQLANATNISCDYAYQIVEAIEKEGGYPKESIDYSFICMNIVMMQIVRCVGIGVLLLYYVGQAYRKVTLSTIVKVALVTGVISFLVLHIKAFRRPIVYADAIVKYDFGRGHANCIYDFIYLALIVPILFFRKTFLEQQKRLEDEKTNSDKVGVCLIAVSTLVILAVIFAKNRIVDFREYGSIHRTYTFLRGLRIGESVIVDFGYTAIVILFELIVIWISKKLINKKVFLFLIPVVVGIGYIFYYDTHYFWITTGDYYANEGEDLLGRLITFFNPIQLIIAVFLIYAMEKKAAAKKIFDLKETLVVICTAIISYFYEIPSKGWLLRSFGMGTRESCFPILDAATDDMIVDSIYNYEEQVLHRSLLAFIVVAMTLVLVIAIILIVHQRKITFSFNKIEVIIDTLFCVMIILGICFYVDRFYSPYYRSEPNMQFKMECRSILMNLWFSALIIVGVYIGTQLMTKIKIRIVKIGIVVISLVIALTSKILMSAFFETLQGKKLRVYIVSIPNANGCLVVAESLIRAVAVGILIYVVIRGIKKQITPMQTGVLVAALNILTLCRYTLDQHDFYKSFPFENPVYMMNDFQNGRYSGITFVIGLIPLYLVIKAVFFNKKLKLPVFEKRDIISMLVGLGILLTTCWLVIQNQGEKVKILYSEICLLKRYIGTTAIIVIVFFSVVGVGHIIGKRCCKVNKDINVNEE